MMTDVSNDSLINAAAAVLNKRVVGGGRLFGSVGSALVTDRGSLFVGVCIDTGSGTGFCAEHSAIAAMVTAGECKISKIVAVWRDDKDLLYVLPPCGRCREFIRQIDEGNLAAEIVFGRDESIPLTALLPHYDWPGPLR